MARTKLSDRFSRKLGKIGKSTNSSYYVTLPIDIVRAFNWREGQNLTVRKTRNGNKIIIEDNSSE